MLRNLPTITLYTLTLAFVTASILSFKTALHLVRITPQSTTWIGLTKGHLRIQTEALPPFLKNITVPLAGQRKGPGLHLIRTPAKPEDLLAPAAARTPRAGRTIHHDKRKLGFALYKSTEQTG